ncbi:hypothetical protein [Massilia sp. TS11]|nr:hypothetical protein [Massilia sp. TS11]
MDRRARDRHNGLQFKEITMSTRIRLGLGALINLAGAALLLGHLL